MPLFAILVDGFVDQLFELDAIDPAIPGLQPLDDWPGWSPPPQPHLRLRRLGPGDYAWEDPRSTTQRSADARAQRDTLLTACDWLVTRAMEQGAPVPSEWAAYRQALRDLPQQAGFPDDITWPTPPTVP